MSAVNQKALEEKLAQASPSIGKRTVDEVRDFLLSADDAELININPFRFASRRGLQRITTLQAFLHLTANGVFDLFWTIHCPSCKGATQHSNRLQELRHAARCDFCDVNYSAGFDKSIEVSFAANPAVVKLAGTDPFGQFEASVDTEPGISIEIDPGKSHYLRTELRQGNYLAIHADGRTVINIAVSPGPAAGRQVLTLTYREGQGLLEVMKGHEGETELVFVNHAPSSRKIRFARMAPTPWPSAALVSSLQEFRNLFSSAMLSPAETFSIESLAFLFTDIKGSTELYERLGDSEAFALVKEHFRIMERIVAQHQGGIVKTIGDAIMAAFTDPQDALRSAVEMIEAFDDLETAKKLKNAIVIKAGIHYGPCIAVTLNERLDYFGTAVNVSARVQGLSDGRDVMASEAIFRESGAGEYLRERGWNEEPFVTSLKGLKASYSLHKLSRRSA